ncbi:uncharacterized protein LOC135161903 [Diachasmimorpha longicaudata]|uniref:uncharacterized protein LOC135161903 n=1 Tax=Diachasmimorpha longicaudata TaxID=58733 RepID=UPI0030B91C5C
MIRLRKTNHNHYEIKDLFSQAGGPLDDKDDDRISIEVDESSDTGDKENVKKQRNKRSDGERKRKQIVADSSPEMGNEMEIEKSSKLREERRKVVSDSSPEEFVKHQGSTEIDKEMEIARSKSSTSQKTKTQGLLTASSASNITNSEELKKETSKKKIPEYKDAELLQGLGGTINNCRSWKNNNEDHNDNNGRDEEAAGGNVVEDGAQNADD